MKARLQTRPALAIGLCAVVVAVLTSCSSSTKRSTDNAGTLATGSTSAAVSSAPAGGSGDAATKTAITTSFVTFFNGSAAIDQRVAVLQNASAFTDALAAQAANPLIKQTSGTVSQITVTSPTQASVVYSVLIATTPVLTNQTGTAVLISGGWKVSATTFCAILAAQGPVPPVCSQASVTALPS